MSFANKQVILGMRAGVKSTRFFIAFPEETARYRGGLSRAINYRSLDARAENARRRDGRAAGRSEKGQEKREEKGEG